MLPHIQAVLRGRLAPFFKQDVDHLVSWLNALEDRRAVIVVGAGFSKNAVWRPPRSGSAASAIPLWSKLEEVLSDDLRLRDGVTYDSLLLPDVYAADQGDPRYHEVLRKILPDDDIEPGPAHHALFRLHRPEAVITTNQLDTLLDGGIANPEAERRWFGVRRDTDLAQPEAERRVQLIYLHGHRSDPTTWVFGRSHYEDLDLTRPVMMRRVRQLLAQHPVLFVGFSLTDPNFHALVRQIDREMHHQRPHALAIMTSAQPSPFVTYWAGHRVRIATMADAVDVHEAFMAVFDAVGAVGRDRRPAEGVLTREEVISTLLAQRGLGPRVEALRTILVHRSAPGGSLRAPDASAETALFREIWEEIALPENQDDRSRVRSGPRFVTPDYPGFDELEEDRRREIREEHSYPFLGALPPGRFRTSDRTARIVSFQIRRGSGIAEAADWLRLWFEAFIDTGTEPSHKIERDVGAFCDLLSWALTSAVPTRGLAQATEQVLCRCLEILRRYEDPRLENVQRDLASVGVAPAPTETSRTVIALREANALAFDARFAEAVDRYAGVARNAAEFNWTWIEYLAIEGAIAAHGAMNTMVALATDGQTWKADLASRRADWAERSKTLSSTPVVADWLSRLDERKHRLAAAALEERRREERERLRMSKTLVFSGVHHDVWTSWRDLEENGASPWTVSPLVQWSIDAKLFESDPLEEVRLRLKYGVKDTAARLVDLSYKGRPADAMARRERDRSLSQMLLASGGTQTESVAALDALSGVRFLLQASQVDEIPPFLVTLRGRLGPRASTYATVHHLSQEYAKGWSEFAHALTNTAQLDALDGYVRQVSDPLEVEEVIRTASRFPWRRWAAFRSKEALMQLAGDWRRAERSQPRYCPAVIECVAAEHLYQPEDDESPTGDTLSHILDAAREAAEYVGPLDDYAKRLAVRLAARFSHTPQEFRSIASLAYPRLGDDLSSLSVRDFFKRAEQVAAFVSAAAERHDCDEALTESATKLQAGLKAHLPKVIERTSKNPHHGFGDMVLDAVTASARREQGTLPRELAHACLELVQAEPGAISALAPILAAEYWPASDWQHLQEVVLRYARPSPSADGQDREVSVVAMLRGTLMFPEIAEAEWLLPAWAAALSNCVAESTLLANHQAALAGAVVCTNTLPTNSAVWRLAAAGVRAAARDARPVIRIGVANVHNEIPANATGLVEEVRNDLLAAFKDETYASVIAASAGADDRQDTGS